MQGRTDDLPRADMIVHNGHIFHCSRLSGYFWLAGLMSSEIASADASLIVVTCLPSCCKLIYCHLASPFYPLIIDHSSIHSVACLHQVL